MAFVSAAAPLAMYDAGDSEGAARLAARVLELDANAAEAHLCLGLIRLRAGDAAGMIESLRHCVRVRSGVWVLDLIRDDFRKHGMPGLPTALVFRLGSFLRSQLSPLGPPLPPEQRRSDHQFVNVVGTSYVRSFGASTALFPLFIGMGPTMLLLTEEASALTRRKFAENLQRVDPSRDTLLVVGGDAFYHHRNILKTRTHDSETPQESDRELMRLVAKRHGPMFADARKLMRGRLFMLGSTPTFSAFVDEIALDLNRYLEPVCAEHGVELLDCWAELADPVTGRLRENFSANAYPGDIHYSLQTVPIFLDALKARGALGADIPSKADYEWASVFDCEVDKAERTRIWSEPSVSPNNAFKSDKIAATHLAGNVADLAAFLLGCAPARTLGLVNVRDGVQAILIPAQLHSGAVAITDGEPNRRAAQMALDFYGRSDVQLSAFSPAVTETLKGQALTVLIILIHPGTEAEDEARANAILGALGPVSRVIVATSDPDRLSKLALGNRRMSGAIDISNRHIPEKWRRYALFLSS